MSFDESDVSIEMRRTDLDRLISAEFEGDKEDFIDVVCADHITIEDDLAILEKDDVNNADWNILQNLLAKYSIEYDKFWGNGDHTPGGKEYVRFIDGERREKQIYDDQDDFLNFLKEVKELAPEEAKRRLQEEYKKLMPFEVIPLKAGLTHPPTKGLLRKATSSRAPGM